MTDRTSASIFGTVFRYLAEQPDDRARGLAQRLWNDLRQFDFNYYDMHCDDALIVFGLARKHDGEMQYLVRGKWE